VEGRLKFERESWRKLYIAESAEHRLLSVVARGLRDYLLRLATEDGTILSATEKPCDDLLRLMRAESAEKRLLRQAYEDLIRIGYLSFSGGRLWITRFVDAQAARSPGAQRQADYKQRQRERIETLQGHASPDDAPGTSPESSPNASPVTSPGDAQVTSHLDETRRDETRKQSRAQELEVFEFWKSETGKTGSTFDDKRRARIRARLNEGFTVERLKAAIRQRRNDPHLMGQNASGRVYDGIETLLRDAAQVERLEALTSPLRGTGQLPLGASNSNSVDIGTGFVRGAEGLD
jgi:hypothetical protein